MGGGAGRTLKQVAHVTQDEMSHLISTLQEVGRRTVGCGRRTSKAKTFLKCVLFLHF